MEEHRHYCPTCHWCVNERCHINPPSAQLLMGQNMAGQTQPVPVAFLPPVQRTDFCSKHSALTQGRVIEAN